MIQMFNHFVIKLKQERFAPNIIDVSSIFGLHKSSELGYNKAMKFIKMIWAGIWKYYVFQGNFALWTKQLLELVQPSNYSMTIS